MQLLSRAHDNCCDRFDLLCALTCTARPLFSGQAGGERGCRLSSSTRLLAHHPQSRRSPGHSVYRRLLARGRLEQRRTATALNARHQWSVLLLIPQSPSLAYRMLERLISSSASTIPTHLHLYARQRCSCSAATRFSHPARVLHARASSRCRAERNPAASQRSPQRLTLLFTNCEVLAHSERVFASPRNLDAPEAALAQGLCTTPRSS